jgi:hypothetical protein
LRSVFDDKNAVIQDGVITEGELSRCALQLNPAASFEPLPVMVNEGDQGNGNAEHLLSQPRNSIKMFLWRGVHDLECG